MPVSFTGLDLSFLNDPANRLPPGKPKERIDWSEGRAQNVATPYFIGDIKPFVANATREPVEITSRSALRRYERDNGLRQCGDYKPGEVIAAQNKRVQEATSISDADKKASDFKWTD
jgi:hypothetical protein